MVVLIKTFVIFIATKVNAMLLHAIPTHFLPENNPYDSNPDLNID